MKIKNREIGKKYEKIAVKFLKKHNFSIIFCNYANKIGEIDIIAKEKNTVVFVEVKYRSDMLFGRPCEAVDKFKQEKIRKVASIFIANNNLSGCDFRFDVIEILDDKINHIKDAF